jgi:hypothetical protein
VPSDLSNECLGVFRSGVAEFRDGLNDSVRGFDSEIGVLVNWPEHATDIRHRRKGIATPTSSNDLLNGAAQALVRERATQTTVVQGDDLLGEREGAEVREGLQPAQVLLLRAFLHLLFGRYFLGPCIAAIFRRLAAAESSNVRHMPYVTGRRHPALSAGHLRLFLRPLVGGPFRVRRLAALTRDFPLFVWVHRREAALSHFVFHISPPNL